MTNHLRSEQFIDALDEALGAKEQAHLARCLECQEELSSLRAILGDAGQAPAPTPSPLFWEHFSERVRQATATETLPSRAYWWQGWRTAGVMAGAVAVIAAVLVVNPSRVKPTEEAVVVGAGESADIAFVDDGSWNLVVDMASELDLSDVKEAIEPAAGTADRMIDNLTASQRTALAKLLQKEMGDF